MIKRLIIYFTGIRSEYELNKKLIGQYYTPADICYRMAYLGLSSFKKESLKILDPSCGNGNFLAACIKNIRSYQNLKKIELWGIEIDSEELDSASRLLNRLKNTYLDEKCQISVNLLNRDYFDILIERDNYLPGDFDILIGNPPYVRHELIRNKTNLRRKMLSLRYPDEQECSSSKRHKKTKFSEFDHPNISSRSDLYCYFLVTATYLLKNQSLLLYLVPMKWLQSVYGTAIRRHILDHYCIEKIIHIEKNIFPGVLVDSIILFLRKEPKTKLRKNNIVYYGSLDPFNGTEESPVLPCRNSTTTPQSSLELVNNWYLHFERPQLLTTVMNHESIVPLAKYPGITVKWGIKTGAENFFYLTEKKSILHKIQDGYMELALKSPKDLFKHSGKHFYHYLLKIPPVEKKFLPEEVRNYIRNGENLMLHKRASIKNRNPWYSLKTADKPDIFIPNFLWNQPLFFLENSERAAVSYNFHSIFVKDKNMVKYLLGYLNSTFGLLHIELLGRKEGGGVLHLQTRDLREVPIINPDYLSKSSIKSIEDLFIMLHLAVSKPKRSINEIDRIRSKLDQKIASILIDLYGTQDV
ncbi:MAG: HsdM family class I SAM-dependent methyltransferase, partial [Candidatus Hodarchaeales archaeon]